MREAAAAASAAEASSYISVRSCVSIQTIAMLCLKVSPFNRELLRKYLDQALSLLPYCVATIAAGLADT